MVSNQLKLGFVQQLLVLLTLDLLHSCSVPNKRQVKTLLDKHFVTLNSDTKVTQHNATLTTEGNSAVYTIIKVAM